MSMVTVHGPNTMYTTQAGGTPVASSPAGAQAVKSPTNGLTYSFSFPNPGSRPATDFDWTFTGPGSPAAQADRYSGTVTYTGAGAGTIVCTVAAGAGPPAAGTYTITTAPTAGVPRSLPPGEEEPPPEDEYDPNAPDVEYEPETGYDPGEHTVTEVIGYVEDNPDELDAVFAAEQAGKARVTLLTHLESMREA